MPAILLRCFRMYYWVPTSLVYPARLPLVAGRNNRVPALFFNNHCHVRKIYFRSVQFTCKYASKNEGIGRLDGTNLTASYRPLPPLATAVLLGLSLCCCVCIIQNPRAEALRHSRHNSRSPQAEQRTGQAEPHGTSSTGDFNKIPHKVPHERIHPGGSKKS